MTVQSMPNEWLRECASDMYLLVGSLCDTSDHVCETVYSNK